MREALVERAKVRVMIPYSEMVEKITTIELEPNSYALAEMLGEVSTEEALPTGGALGACRPQGRRHAAGAWVLRVGRRTWPGYFGHLQVLGGRVEEGASCVEWEVVD